MYMCVNIYYIYSIYIYAYLEILIRKYVPRSINNKGKDIGLNSVLSIAGSSKKS